MHNNLGLLTLLATFAVGCAPASPIHSMGGADPVLQSVVDLDISCENDDNLIASLKYKTDERIITFRKVDSPATHYYNLAKARKDNGADIVVSNNALATDYDKLPETANILHIQTTEYGVVHGEVRVVSKTALKMIKNAPVGSEVDYENADIFAWHDGSFSVDHDVDYDYEAEEMERLCTFSFPVAGGVEIDPTFGTPLATQEEIDALSSME